MENLLKQAKAGDQAAENELFSRLLVRFRIFAKHRVMDSLDAEDLANDACLTVIQKYKDENITENIMAWSFGVLKMKIGNYLQKQRVRKKTKYLDFQDEKNQPASYTEFDPDLRIRMINCLKSLVSKYSKYARVLNLVYQGYGTQEIIGKLGITRNNLYVILNRGRSLLKSCLETGRA